MARGIVAVGSMMAASINKTAVALRGALDNYASNAINRSPGLSEPLTLSKSYVSRWVWWVWWVWWVGASLLAVRWHGLLCACGCGVHAHLAEAAAGAEQQNTPQCAVSPVCVLSFHTPIG